MVIFFLMIASLSTTIEVFAASCCGGSPTSFLVPLNSEAIVVNVSNSYINGVGRAFQNNSDLVKWSEKERTINALDLSGSFLIGERFSVSGHGGIHFSQFKSDQQNSNSRDQQMTDLLLSVNYELLPEYTYHPYKPKIFTSLFLNLPSGQSVLEPGTLSEAANVTGHSLWGTGAGITLYKSWYPFILNQQLKFLYLFSEKLGGAKISDYYDFSSSTRFTLAFNRSINGFVGVSWAYISKRNVNSFILKNVSNSLVALSSQSTTVNLGVSYSLSENLNLSIAYSDQTLLGLPRNVVLNRTYNINLNSIF